MATSESNADLTVSARLLLFVSLLSVCLSVVVSCCLSTSIDAVLRIVLLFFLLLLNCGNN